MFRSKQSAVSPELGWFEWRCAHTQRERMPTLHNNRCHCFSFAFDVMRCRLSRQFQFMSVRLDFSVGCCWAICLAAQNVSVRTVDVVSIFSYSSVWNWCHCAFYWMYLHVNRLSKSVLLSVREKVLNVLVSWKQISHGIVCGSPYFETQRHFELSVWFYVYARSQRMPNDYKKQQLQTVYLWM